MNIVFLDADTLGHDVSLEPISKLGIFTKYNHTNLDEVVPRSKDADIIITNKVILNQDIIAQLPNLKLICVAATGTNNIDLEFAKSKNILVKNAKNYSTDSVAQHTFTMLLALIGNIAWYDEYVKSGAYAQGVQFTNLERPYYELAGKTLGIIGMGNIGRKVAQIATAFGAKVIYTPVSGGNRKEAYPSVDLNQLLQTSDIVSIHSPLNDKTKNLINDEKIKLMPKNAILINVGRGGIVNEKALAEALDNDGILGACVDVFEKEPITSENPLMAVEKKYKLIMTPHTAWASREAREKLILIIADNIKDAIQHLQF